MKILTRIKEKATRKLQTWKVDRAGKGNILLRTESGDQQIVVAVILIVIAVGLAVIFKEQIGNIITSNITAIGTKIETILAGF